MSGARDRFRALDAMRRQLEFVITCGFRGVGTIALLK